MASSGGRLAAAAVVSLAVAAVLWVLLGRTPPQAPSEPSVVSAPQAPAAAPSSSRPAPTPEQVRQPQPNAPATGSAPPQQAEANFDDRLAAAEAGDIEAAYEIGLTMLLCLQSASTVREATEDGLTLPAVDLSRYDCDDILVDTALADQLLRQAADEGHVEAAREYAIAAVSLTPLESTEGLRNPTQSDLVTLAASEYRSLDYLEFAATSGDLPAAKHLAQRLAQGFAVPIGGNEATMQLRAGEPAQALAWFYALRIADDDPWMQSWSQDLRGQLDPQEIMEAEAKGQEYYYSYLEEPR